MIAPENIDVENSEYVRQRLCQFRKRDNRATYATSLAIALAAVVDLDTLDWAMNMAETIQTSI
jgi:hypothetical protein